MPEIKPRFEYRKWQFRNKGYKTAPWHHVISQYELDLLSKYPEKFEVRYNPKGNESCPNTKQSVVR